MGLPESSSPGPPDIQPPTQHSAVCTGSGLTSPRDARLGRVGHPPPSIFVLFSSPRSAMPLSVERRCVEAVFFVALAVATAGLHHAHGFLPAFAGFSSSPHAAAAAAAAAASASGRNSALYNYVCLLVAAAAAYAAARTVAFYATAVLSPPPPPLAKSKSSTDAALQAALTLCLPVLAAFGCYVGAGYPSLGGTVAAKWVSANWERNGERDLMWCCRLFALLFCWQAALSGVVAACRALAGGVSRRVASALEAASSAGGTGGAARGGKQLEQRQPQPSSSSSSSSSGSSISSGKSPVVEGGNDAPGWERKRKEKAPLENITAGFD